MQEDINNPDAFDDALRRRFAGFTATPPANGFRTISAALDSLADNAVPTVVRLPWYQHFAFRLVAATGVVVTGLLFFFLSTSVLDNKHLNPKDAVKLQSKQIEISNNRASQLPSELINTQGNKSITIQDNINNAKPAGVNDLGIANIKSNNLKEIGTSGLHQNTTKQNGQRRKVTVIGTSAKDDKEKGSFTIPAQNAKENEAKSLVQAQIALSNNSLSVIAPKTNPNEVMRNGIIPKSKYLISKDKKMYDVLSQGNSITLQGGTLYTDQDGASSNQSLKNKRKNRIRAGLVVGNYNQANNKKDVNTYVVAAANGRLLNEGKVRFINDSTGINKTVAYAIDNLLPETKDADTLRYNKHLLANILPDKNPSIWAGTFAEVLIQPRFMLRQLQVNNTDNAIVSNLSNANKYYNERVGYEATIRGGKNIGEYQLLGGVSFSRLADNLTYTLITNDVEGVTTESQGNSQQITSVYGTYTRSVLTAVSAVGLQLGGARCFGEKKNFRISVGGSYSKVVAGKVEVYENNILLQSTAADASNSLQRQNNFSGYISAGYNKEITPNVHLILEPVVTYYFRDALLAGQPLGFKPLMMGINIGLQYKIR